MKGTDPLDWALFTVRLIVGTALIAHGGQRILEHFGYPGPNFFVLWSGGHNGLICLTPLIELIGGGLILAGFLIEIGTILVVPAILFSFFITNLGSGSIVHQGNPRLLLNLIMLVVVIGICGPGKWALWDPGKSLRKKIF